MAEDGESSAPEVVQPDHVPEAPEEPGQDAAETAVVDAPAPETDPVALPVPTADTLQRYLTEIRRIPVLSREEEHALAVRWHEHGDRSAAVRLVTSRRSASSLCSGANPSCSSFSFSLRRLKKSLRCACVVPIFTRRQLLRMNFNM